MKTAIKISSNDNVAVVTTDCFAGESIKCPDAEAIELLSDIPAGHKVALININKGENIIKYGFVIGCATDNIPKGGQVHIHNMRTRLSAETNFKYAPDFQELPSRQPEMFSGYLRKNGEAGVRNEIWIIPTVGCINQLARNIARHTENLKCDHIDGIYAFEHPFGCSQLGDDHITTQQVLAGLIKNPNAGAVLVLGLGCENNHVEEFKKVLGVYDNERVVFLVAQQYEDELQAGIETINSLAAITKNDQRQPLPCSMLKVGLKCGGSDAFSGITANPLLGRFSDMLVSAGGTTALTEIPEMFGAEGVILNRCINTEVFSKASKLIKKFRDYYQQHGEPVSENPSPGNKAGGISSLEDKSLGCVQKGGASPVQQVITYGQRLSTSGLAIIDGPGNDMVAVSNLAAAGCQMILFTTGRGTPLGAPVPTVKVSSNSQLAEKKKNWIDFDAGKILSGESMEILTEQLFEKVMDIASGKPTKNEINNYREISIFKQGVTL